MPFPAALILRNGFSNTHQELGFVKRKIQPNFLKVYFPVTYVNTTLIVKGLLAPQNRLQRCVFFKQHAPPIE